MTQDQIKRKLIDAGRILEAEGHGDLARGHISVRIPGDPGHFYMKPHGFGLDEITLDNLVVCDLEGEKTAGGGPRHSEVYIHSEIYRLRADVACVLHTHPDYTVAFSATGLELRPLSQPAAAFFESLSTYTDTIDLIRSKEMGAGVARALGPNKAVLLKNHGVAVGGASIEETVILALMLENACRLQILTLSAGRLAPEFPRADVLRLQDKITRPEQYSINFDYLRRKHTRPNERGPA